MTLSAGQFFHASLFVLATLLSPLAIAETDNKAATEAQLKSVNEDIEHLRSLLEKLNRERSSAEKQLQATEQQMNEIQKSVQSLERKLGEGQAEAKKLERRRQVLAANRDSEKDKVADSVRSAYLASRDNKLKLILNQESPEEVSRHLAYLKYLQQAQLDAINRFESTLRELESLAQQQQELNKRLENEKRNLQVQRQQLSKTQAERKQLISSINQRHSASGKQLGQLDEQRQELESILSQLASRTVNARPLTESKGKLPWPVQGSVIYDYNEQRPETRMRWQGVLVAVETGTRVLAVHNGTVIFSNWLRGFGQLIIVDHGNDYLTLYAHNQWLLKSEGEQVLAGETLALSGQSGGLEQPGVYFELRHNGTPQNPRNWLGRQ